MDVSSTSCNESNVTGEENHVELSAEQEEALKYVCQGKNVFITGSAGVGKSFLLKEILNALKHQNVYVTASTGVAACNIGGTTLHSFSGIGLGEKPVKEIVYQILYKNYRVEVRQRWQTCDTLVIDEISMIDGEVFSKVEEIARLVRNDPRPFGGIQLILCGDFLQLPPVNVKKFAFETKAWKSVIHETIVLKKVFRQKLVGFVALLNRMRYGQLKAVDIEVLHECSKTVFPDDGIRATRLFPFRAACDQLNIRELSKLPGQSIVFTATDWARDQTFRDQLQKNCKYPQVLELKVGAQVMLLTNLSVAKGLVNGARGVVIGYKNKQKEIQEEIESYMGSPNDSSESERLAYMEFLKSLSEKESRDDGYPLVKFSNGIEECIKPDQIKIELNKRMVAYRVQIPLNLAWAVSIHKAQGMTLERVDINIARVFEHGQAYVALSRVTCLKGLLLRDFDPSKITAHPKVLKYYNEISPNQHQWSNIGESELKKFIDFRRNPSKYKAEIEAEERIAQQRRLSVEKEKLEETVSFLEENRLKAIVTEDHSYATPVSLRSIPRPKFILQNHNVNASISLIDLTSPNQSNSFPSPQGSFNTPIMSQSDPSFICGDFETPPCVESLSSTSTPLPTIYSTALSEAEKRLAKCKALLKGIKLTMNEDDCDAKLDSIPNKSLTQESSVQPQSTDQNQNYGVEENTGSTSKLHKEHSEPLIPSDNNKLIMNNGGQVTIVVESDEENDVVNANEDTKHNLTDVNENTNNISTKEEKEHQPLRRSSRNRKRKSYDEFILPDLNKENVKKTNKNRKNNCSSPMNEWKNQEQNLNSRCKEEPTAINSPNINKCASDKFLTPTKSSFNIGKNGYETPLKNGTDIAKQHSLYNKACQNNFSQHENLSESDCKRLLEEKREEIEKKRMQALTKRLNSLKRHSMGSPLVRPNTVFPINL